MRRSASEHAVYSAPPETSSRAAWIVEIGAKKAEITGLFPDQTAFSPS